MTPIDILLSSSTSPSATGLAHTVASALREVGAEAAVVVDEVPEPREDRVTLVVSPHDVYPHLAVGDGQSLAATLPRTLLLLAERPGTAEWEAALPYAPAAGGVLDVSAGGVRELARRGVAARHMPLGYHASLDGWGGRTDERPLDVVFLGAATPRRMRTLAAAGSVLSEHDTDLRVVHGAPGERYGSRDFAREFMAPEERRALLARAKVLLNVHRDESPRFEWQRALDALCNGALLVTEESIGVAPLVPGRHFISGTTGSLPHLLDVVLRDAGRREQVAHEAYAFVREHLPLTRSAEILAELAEDLPGPSTGVGISLASVSAAAAQAFTPPTAIIPPQPDGDSPTDQLVEIANRQNAVLKKLFFDLRLMRRQIATIAHTVQNPDAPLVERHDTPAAAAVTPDVTVVISLYNYGRFVVEALGSVCRTRDCAFEIIVVDDASIDGSADVVRSFMAEHPEAPITLFAQKVNTGVQRARNLAFSHARAPYAFVLDADNVVYPRGIAKLRDALAADPGAAFSYGLIERFGDAGSLDLLGTQGYDPALLVHGNYIDAMALVRVDAWRQVGGYVSDPLFELGAEDYDLWLSFATAGLYGVHVREIVGRYRIHGVSSLTMTTLDTKGLMAMLRQRHASFFAQAGRTEG